MSEGQTKVKLKSSNEEMFEVDKSVANEMQTMRNLIGDIGADILIPLPTVSSKILRKVILYCTYHVEARKSSDGDLAVPDDEIRMWDAQFTDIDSATLTDLLLAATDLNIENLLNLTLDEILLC